MNKHSEEAKTIKYVIERSNETISVEVPEDWKVTWGPAAPGQKRDFHYDQSGGYTLRFYEGGEKQRACFSNVVSFRLASIPVQRYVRRKKGQSEWVSDPNYAKSVTEEEVEERWEDLPW